MRIGPRPGPVQAKRGRLGGRSSGRWPGQAGKTDETAAHQRA